MGNRARPAEAVTQAVMKRAGVADPSLAEQGLARVKQAAHAAPVARAAYAAPKQAAASIPQGQANAYGPPSPDGVVMT